MGKSRTAKNTQTAPREKPRAAPLLHPRIALVLIICIAAFLRLYQLTTIPPGIYADEAMNGTNILQNLETSSLKVFYPENNGREGLYIAIATPFVAVFGNTAWALRLPAALIGILTVLGIYFLGRELFGEATGLLSAFFLAISFWHLNFSRIAFRAIASPLLLTWSLFLLIGTMRRLREAGPYSPAIIGAATLYGLGFYTYIAYRATPVLIGAILLHLWLEARRTGWSGRFYRAAGLFIFVAAIVVTPLFLYFARNPGSFFARAEQISIATQPDPIKAFLTSIWLTGRMFFVGGDANWRHNIAERSELYWPMAILFAVGLILAVWRIYKSAENVRLASAVTLAWLLVAGLPVVLSEEGLPHALRSILMIPAVFLLTATGAKALYDVAVVRINSGILRPVVVAILGLLGIEAYHSYFNVWATNPQVAYAFTTWSKDIAERINSLPREAPKYIVVVSPGVLVNGVPMPAQSVMYLTRSHSSELQRERNIHYIPAPARSREEAASTCREHATRLAPSAVFCL